MKTAVQEKPILFSGPMVQAILAGTKTQTRRIVKQPEFIETDDDGKFAFSHARTCGGGCDYACASRGEVLDGHIGWTPWGSHPGEWGRLWVREAWRTAAQLDECNAAQIEERCLEANYRRPWAPLHYPADDTRLNWDRLWSEPGRLRHARFMPRWASRITLEIDSVRVERLLDISEADAMAEGVAASDAVQCADGSPCYTQPFRALWTQIHGIDNPNSWDASPWVWCIAFRRLEQPQ